MGRWVPWAGGLAVAARTDCLSSVLCCSQLPRLGLCHALPCELASPMLTVLSLCLLRLRPAVRNDEGCQEGCVMAASESSKPNRREREDTAGRRPWLSCSLQATCMTALRCLPVTTLSFHSSTANDPNGHVTIGNECLAGLSVFLFINFAAAFEFACDCCQTVTLCD